MGRLRVSSSTSGPLVALDDEAASTRFLDRVGVEVVDSRYVDIIVEVMRRSYEVPWVSVLSGWATSIIVPRARPTIIVALAIVPVLIPVPWVGPSCWVVITGTGTIFPVFVLTSWVVPVVVTVSVGSSVPAKFLLPYATSGHCVTSFITVIAGQP